MCTPPRFATGDATDPDGAATNPSAVTDPHAATDPSSTTPGAVSSGGDALLGGLRRQRPPPKLTPRVMAASEGGEAVAYYAAPQAAPARFDTPPPEPALEIASPPSPASLLDTVRRPRASSSRHAVLIGVTAGCVAVAGLFVWLAAAPGGGSRDGVAAASAPVAIAPPPLPTLPPSPSPSSASTDVANADIAPIAPASAQTFGGRVTPTVTPPAASTSIRVVGPDLRRPSAPATATTTALALAPPTASVAASAPSVPARTPRVPSSGSFEEPVRTF